MHSIEVDVTENLSSFISIIDDYSKSGFYSIRKDTQKHHIFLLNGILKSLDRLRSEFIIVGDDTRANECLDIRMYAYTARYRINTFLLLKNHKVNKAYDELIQAQRAAEKAIYAGFDEKRFSEHLNFLEDAERILFPRQIWQSIGLVAHRIMCSVCGLSIDKCDHRYGKPYSGYLCYYKYEDLEIDHSAVIVEGRPENKMCRITQYTSEGAYFDCLTKERLRLAPG